MIGVLSKSSAADKSALPAADALTAPFAKPPKPHVIVYGNVNFRIPNDAIKTLVESGQVEVAIPMSHGPVEKKKPRATLPIKLYLMLDTVTGNIKLSAGEQVSDGSITPGWYTVSMDTAVLYDGDLKSKKKATNNAGPVKDDPTALTFGEGMEWSTFYDSEKDVCDISATGYAIVPISPATMTFDNNAVAGLTDPDESMFVDDAPVDSSGTGGSSA